MGSSQIKFQFEARSKKIVLRDLWNRMCLRGLGVGSYRLAFLKDLFFLSSFKNTLNLCTTNMNCLLKFHWRSTIDLTWNCLLNVLGTSIQMWSLSTCNAFLSNIEFGYLSLDFNYLSNHRLCNALEIRSHTWLSSKLLSFFLLIYSQLATTLMRLNTFPLIYQIWKHTID